MGKRRYLYLFGLGGGLTAGVIATALLSLFMPMPGYAWLIVVGSCAVTFTGFGYITWFQLAQRRAERLRIQLDRLATGDLTRSGGRNVGQESELHRLTLSLRRALSQVQRVTQTLHRTSRDVETEARSLLEAARRQQAAADAT